MDASSGGRRPLRRRHSSLGLWRLDFSRDDVAEEPIYINLFDDGSVATAEQSHLDLLGRWKLQGREFKLGLDRKTGTFPIDDDVRFLGVLAPNCSAVSGSVMEGQLDPVVTGRFLLRQMPDPFRPSSAASLRSVAAAQAAAAAARAPRLSGGDFAGSWVLSLSYQSTTSTPPPLLPGQRRLPDPIRPRTPYQPPVVYEVNLSPAGTFRTSGGFGPGSNGPSLSGWWKLNADDETICLEAVRGMSLGVSMTADYLYWGKVERRGGMADGGENAGGGGGNGGSKAGSGSVEPAAAATAVTAAGGADAGAGAERAAATAGDRSTGGGSAAAAYRVRGTIMYGTFEPLRVGKFEMSRKQEGRPEAGGVNSA